MSSRICLKICCWANLAIGPELIDTIITAKLKVAGQTRVNRTTDLIRAVLNKAQKEWGWIETVPYIRRFKVKSQRLRWLSMLTMEKDINGLKSYAS